MLNKTWAFALALALATAPVSSLLAAGGAGAGGAGAGGAGAGGAGAVPVEQVVQVLVPEGAPAPPTARTRSPGRLLQMPVHRRRKWIPLGRGLLRPAQATPRQQTTGKSPWPGEGAARAPSSRA